MIRELSDGDPAPLRKQQPKYVKLAMYESKYGFFLQPVCLLTLQKVEINRVQIPKKNRTLLENTFGGEETWQVQVWESAEGYDSPTPTWMVTFDPDTTYEEAKKVAEEVREMYEHWDDTEEIAQFFRMADTRISLPPKRPPLEQLAKEDPQAAQAASRIYEIHREERAARFKVLSVVLPKTVELAEKAEQETDPEIRQQLEGESLEAYFSENAPGWPPFIFKGWQKLNPIGLKWIQWLYVWQSRRMKSRVEINAADYELAFNWRWKDYYLLTAEQLKDEIQKETKQLLSPDAIKKRRERLGFTTQRTPGPPPNQPSQ